MIPQLPVSSERVQKFARDLEVRQSMGQYVELTSELFDQVGIVKTDKLMDVAFYALMALHVLQNDVFIEPELIEVKEKVVFYLSDALEEAGFDIC